MRPARTGRRRAGNAIIRGVPVRVYMPDPAPTGVPFALPPDEAAHVSRVLRLVAGDALRVFDGRGGEWQATVSSATRAAVTVTLGDAVTPARETRVRYTMALAVLKGDGTDDAIRDAVMMGVSRVRPFVAARSEISLASAARGHRLDRWVRVAVASAKQCGRAVVPEIAPLVEVDALWRQCDDPLRLLLVEPSAARDTRMTADVQPDTMVTIACGPEGGWTSDEMAAAVSAGWTLVSLGARTLRATSAPLAALAACQAVWRDD